MYAFFCREFGSKWEWGRKLEVLLFFMIQDKDSRQTISYCHGQCRLDSGKINIANLLLVVIATNYTQLLPCGSQQCGDRECCSQVAEVGLLSLLHFWHFPSVSVWVLQVKNPRFFSFPFIIWMLNYIFACRFHTFPKGIPTFLRYQGDWEK